MQLIGNPACKRAVAARLIPSLVVFVGLMTATRLFAEDTREKPVLVLEPGGHSADVIGVAFTPDGKTLISTSTDSTIRFWDVATGALVRLLRMPSPIVGHNFGQDALSRDGRLLAVPLGSPDPDHGIALISVPEGRILRYLKTDVHYGYLFYLAFSPDGKRLASTSNDNSAHLWDVATGKCERVLAGHQAMTTGAAFSPDGSQIVTSAVDGTIRIWSVATGESRRVLLDKEPNVGSFSTVAWSPDGKTIAVANEGATLSFWSPDGTLRKRVHPRSVVRLLRFTADSKALLYASDLGGYVLDLEQESYRVEFRLLKDFAWCVALSPDERTAACGGRSGEELYLWSMADGQPLHHLAGPGCSPWGVAWSPDGASVAWGHTGRHLDLRRPDALTVPLPFPRSFRLADLDFGPVPDMTWRRGLATLGTLAVAADSKGVSIKDGEGLLCRIKLPWPQAASFVPGDRFALGSYRCFALYDARSGERLQDFCGHSSEIHAMAPSPDNQYLLTSGADQTLRVWKFGRSEPLCSLFFAGDQWIAWTPEGYYAASSGGERLMGWQVSYDAMQMATFYPAAQFRKSLYRPDVIKRLLEAGSVKKALEMADRANGKTSKPVQVADVLPPQVRITSLRNSPLDASGATAEVSFLVRSAGRAPVTAVRLFVDGRPYPGSEFYKTYDPPRDGELRQSWTVKLDAGSHAVAVQAESSVSRALSEPVELVFARGVRREDTPSKEEVPQLQLPSLYVLAMGVSEYPGDLKLNYAAADAKALAEVYQEHAKPLYRRVESKLIVDKEATRRNILLGLSWLRRQMTQNDVAVVSFAGHGVKDHDGTFYLLPVDGDMNELLSTAVPGDQIKRTLAGIPGRFVLLLDACHAGAVEGESRRAAGALTDDLVRDLATDDYGVIVMCSAMGREFSLESPKIQHGYFTLALVEGLSGKADYNHDGVVQFNELDLYVTDRVKELSQGKQHPVTARPTSIRSFPLTKQ
jgi:WD40 repeat protein